MKKSLLILILILPLVLAPGFFTRAAESFSSDLSRGAAGSAVRNLQKFLLEEGVYSGPITGNFFSLTESAVRRFQAREGLPTTGYFGPQSRAAANALLKGGASAQAQSSLEEQLRSLMAQVAVLQARLAPATPAAATSTTTELNARSIVGLNCFFRHTPTGKILNLGKGSGVIVKADGTILTARHLVDLVYSASVDPGSVNPALLQATVFDHCDVGQVAPGSTLPSADLIRRVNPSTLLPVLAYRAELEYLPSSSSLGVSEVEAAHLDFAVLKIIGLGPDAGYFGITELPAKFETAAISRFESPAEGAEVVTYGFPGDATQARQGAFGTFYLLGSVGRVKQIQGGDLKFLNKPLILNTELEVRGGRSGSPLFWNGKVVGIVTAHAVQNVTDSYSVSMEAIYSLISHLL